MGRKVRSYLNERSCSWSVFLCRSLRKEVSFSQYEICHPGKLTVKVNLFGYIISVLYAGTKYGTIYLR